MHDNNTNNDRDKVCEASLDYKLEYCRLRQENEEQKQYINVYKNIIKELGIVLNSK